MDKMDKAVHNRYHYLIRAGLTMFLALYITSLIRSGSISLYIAPRMDIYVKGVAICLFLVSVQQLYQVIRSKSAHPADCACEQSEGFSFGLSAMRYTLFLFPLLLGLLLPDTSMDGTLAQKKGLDLSTYGAFVMTDFRHAGKAATGETLINELGKELLQQDVIVITEGRFRETLAAIDMNLNAFIGKRVEISGFVFRPNGLPDNQFAVSRFLMQCCSADATPIGVLGESGIANHFPDNSWVHVTGVIKKTIYKGVPVMILKMESIQLAPKPDVPYVYPDYSF